MITFDYGRGVECQNIDYVICERPLMSAEANFTATISEFDVKWNGPRPIEFIESLGPPI